MSYDILSSSSINNLISSYKYTEQQKLLLPLTSRKTKYQNLSSAYGTLSSKLDSLKSLLNTFKQTGSDSPFTVKKGTSSNEAFVSVSASNAASIGTFNLRVSQMAKNDMLVSQNFASDDANVTAGLQSFLIKTGDGKGGFFTSNVQVELSSSETNKTILEKIKDAINADKAVVTSDAKIGSNNYNGGAGSLTIDINGTAHTINYNGGGTYEDLIDEIAGIINTDVSGVAAEKVIDSPNPGDVRLKFTVADSSKYISVSHSSGFDVVSDLNISADKEKSAQSIISASVFSPNTAQSQFSLTAKETGIDFRIAELSDTGGSSILSAIGLNIGSSRPAFDQTLTPNTAGFLYSDISSENNQLNAKLNFNGISIQRSSNSISDLVSGVSFTLKSTMQESDSDVSVTVDKDVAAVKTKVEEFITKFNDVYSYIKSQSGINSGQRGVLWGDSSASSLLSTLNQINFHPVDGIPSGDLNTLSKIGISFNATTGLSISDSAKFEQNVLEKTSEFEALFNSENGIANLLFTKINPYLGAAGMLANSQSSLTTNIKGIDDKIVSIEKRIDRSADVLRRQYEELQIQLATLLTTQSYFMPTDTGSYF